MPKSDAHMENIDYPSIDPHTQAPLLNDVHDIFCPSVMDIKKINKVSIEKYLKAYAQQYGLSTSSEFYKSTSLFEKHKQLTHASSSRTFCVSYTTICEQYLNESIIVSMDPSFVFNKLF